MKVTLYGAAGEVTGSAYHLQSASASVLVDFGIFQGSYYAGAQNVIPCGLRVRELDAIVLTHGHLDHVGRLPLLARAGFQGPIFCTSATAEFARLILRDAAKIQAQDNERTNRKRMRAGEDPLEPMFTRDDVDEVCGLFQKVAYRTPVDVASGVTAIFREAGHMLGSASVELRVETGERTRKVVFSGDIGPLGTPILKDFETCDEADLVFLESTYGDRDHRPLQQTVDEFRAIVREAVTVGGKILVPSFAVGRSQAVLYHLAEMFRDGIVSPFPVYLDSPMAIEANAIYKRHPELFDEESRELRDATNLLSDLDTLRLCESADQSRALNDVDGPCVIIAGAGMCNAGRILHHLRQNLWKPETWVVIVGYQSDGSLGRRLVDGATHVFIHGERIAVRAKIRTLGGLSAHAGQTDLVRWFQPLAAGKPKVALTHGEERGREPLAKLLKGRFGIEALLPMFGEAIHMD